MSADAAQRVRMWAFRNAPPDFQKLLPDGRDADWVIHVPGPERHLAEPPLLRWRRIFPVKSIELADRSVVYWGAVSEAMALLAKGGKPLTAPPPGGEERRTGMRVQIECPCRYETQSEPKQVGTGHTIDMGGSGISFTTESLLPRNIEATLLVTWPARL